MSILESQTQNICLPPRGVSDVSVCGSAPWRATSFASSAMPSSCLTGSTSGSMIHAPIAGPVGAPIMAFGHFVHHSWICVSSVVASLKPFGVSGFLSCGLHGKTGSLLRAYSRAASSRSAIVLVCDCGGMNDPFLTPIDQRPALVQRDSQFAKSVATLAVELGYKPVRLVDDDAAMAQAIFVTGQASECIAEHRWSNRSQLHAHVILP